jgi:hypothetical protein
MLITCPNLQFDLDEDDGESPEHSELVLDAAFSRDASWHDRFGCIADQQTKQSNGSIEYLQERVKITVMDKFLRTCRGKKSGSRFVILVIDGGSILLHDNFNVFNDLFEEGIGNARAMHFECWSIP